MCSSDLGVRMAVRMAEHARAHHRGSVYTLGPLVHNPVTLARLRARGIECLDPAHLSFALHAPAAPGAAPHAVEEKTARTVVIRAHGVAPEVYEALERSGAQVVDATCPRVKESQRRAQGFAAQGLHVILAGDRNHGEIVGIEGYVRAGAAQACSHLPGGAPDGMLPQVQCFVVQNAREAAALPCLARAALLAQTTITQGEYDAIAAAARTRVRELTVARTICAATARRQAALRALAPTVEALLVIGGAHSANTQRLLHTARETSLPTWLVERVEDIPPDIYAFSAVGISAGASTPDCVIAAVEQALRTGGAPVASRVSSSALPKVSTCRAVCAAATSSVGSAGASGAVSPGAVRPFAVGSVR